MPRVSKYEDIVDKVSNQLYISKELVSAVVSTLEYNILENIYYEGLESTNNHILIPNIGYLVIDNSDDFNIRFRINKDFYNKCKESYINHRDYTTEVSESNFDKFLVGRCLDLLTGYSNIEELE